MRSWRRRCAVVRPPPGGCRPRARSRRWWTLPWQDVARGWEWRYLILLEVDAEGILRMDGEVQEISTLAEALEPIATNETVVKVQVHPGTTYRAVSDITDQVRMVGLLRVIFAQEAVEEVYPFVLPSYPQPEQGEPAPPGGFVREINEETLRSRAPSVPAWNLLNLTVLPEGVVRVRRADDPGGAQLMTTQQITQMLATQHAANPNTIAVLLAGAETPYRFVYEVLGAIQESPVNRYSIQVEERGKEEQGARSQDQGG